MSDTQHETGVEPFVEASEKPSDRERREARERAYQDVSLRAVELLAKAQRAADEAVAEAQAYARDLEETAREQYRRILQRAQEAAREAAGASGEAGEATPTQEAPAVAAGPGSAVDAQQLEYVRTYARVAHTQLKAVLGALNDELDRLAELADGHVDEGSAAASAPVADVPEPPAPPHARADESAETDDVDDADEAVDESELGHG